MESLREARYYEVLREDGTTSGGPIREGVLKKAVWERYAMTCDGIQQRSSLLGHRYYTSAEAETPAGRQGRGKQVANVMRDASGKTSSLGNVRCIGTDCRSTVPHDVGGYVKNGKVVMQSTPAAV
jgi:hypothetical protein